jgi:hypothetical protein
VVLAFGVFGLVGLALIADMLAPGVASLYRRWRAGLSARQELSERADLPVDPGRERRAEHTAKELLRSCVGEEEWAMYRELGFMRVWSSAPRSRRGSEHAYLIYAHRPVVAYEPLTGKLIGEYCITFPDDTRPYGSSRLPDSDDVLAKWMLLTGDEKRLLQGANMHLPGRQIPAQQVARDLWRLSKWEQVRMRQLAAQIHT